MTQAVLIVDDEPYILRILSFKLRREGYATYEAQSAEEALDVLSTSPVDLVVLDVGLATSTSGFDLAESLRSDPSMRELPIVMLTARNLREDFLRGRQLGAVGYVTKPFSTAELIDRIHSILR
jgi:DNA-binding response OmpR family regulator